MSERSTIQRVARATVLLAIVMTACRKEPTDPRWDVDLVVPLVRTTLTIGDLIPDSLLSTDEHGNVSLLYTNRLFDLALDTVLTAPDTSFLYTYVLPFPGPVLFPAGATFNSTSDVTQFDLQELQLRELRIRTGQVDVALTNHMNGTIIGNFGLPGATLNGVPFAVEQSVPPGSSSQPSHITATRALDGYILDLRGPQYNAVNTLATANSFTNDPSGGEISVTDHDSLIAIVSYHDIVPEYATGYFGTRDVTFDPSSTPLDLFQNITGLLDLEQVTTRLKVRNGLGVDARVALHYLRSTNTHTGTSVDLHHAITSGPINLDRALDLGGTFQPALNSYLLTENNSNIDAFIENLPDQLDYALDLTIDPLGDVSNGHDFFYYESRLSADLEVEIPLRVIATDLTLQQITAVTLPGTAEGHALQSGTLHLFAANGFPFSAGLQLALVDEQGQVLSALAPGGTIASGTLGADGFVQSPVTTEVNVELSAAQVDLFYTGAQLRITATFNTASQTQHLQLLSSYKLDIQLTASGTYIVNGDE